MTKQFRLAPRDGAFAVLFSVMLVPILGIAALGVDVGYARMVKAELKAATDAAAAAGAVEIDGTPEGLIAATNAALDLAAENYAAGDAVNITTGDVEFAVYDPAGPSFTLSTDPAVVNAIQVNASRSSLLGLFSQWGKLDVAVMSRAGATGGGGDPTGGPTLLTLGENCDPMQNLEAGGSGTIDVSCGTIQVNSNCDCEGSGGSAEGAMEISGSTDISAPGGINVVGEVCTVGGGSTVDPEPTIDAEPIDDPLEGIQPPDEINLTDYGNLAENISGTNTSLNPGIYSYINIGSNATVTMAPGIYVLEGYASQGGINSSFAVGSNSSVSGDGVFIYMSNTGGGYDIDGGAEINLSAGDKDITDWGLNQPQLEVFDGILSWQDNAQESSITGNGSIAMQGIIYAPEAEYTITGNGQAGEEDLVGTSLWVGAATVWGSGTVSFCDDNDGSSGGNEYEGAGFKFIPVIL